MNSKTTNMDKENNIINRNYWTYPYLAFVFETQNVTRHEERDIRSKFSKLIFIVDMIAVSFLFW